jgi:hypothetical protein
LAAPRARIKKRLILTAEARKKTSAATGELWPPKKSLEGVAESRSPERHLDYLCVSSYTGGNGVGLVLLFLAASYKDFLTWMEEID